MNGEQAREVRANARARDNDIRTCHGSGYQDQAHHALFALEASGETASEQAGQNQQTERAGYRQSPEHRVSGNIRMNAGIS